MPGTPTRFNVPALRDERLLKSPSELVRRSVIACLAPPSCFTGATLVLMSDCLERRLDEVEVGEWVIGGTY